MPLPEWEGALFHDIDIRGEPSARVYARLDHRVTVDGSLIAWFDGVDARWADGIESSEGLDVMRKAPVTVTKIRLPPRSDRDKYATTFRSQWVEIELDLSRPGEVEQYPSMFGQPVTAALKGMRPTGRAVSILLNAVFDFNKFPRAKAADLASALMPIRHRAEWLAAFDVGQGACNALIDRFGIPVAYFDFGGGIMGNTKTFPPGLKRFCLTNSPPIILSHWDWDHWSSGARFPDAQNMDWIVPDQSVTRPAHLQFAADVATKGRLLKWHRGTPSPPLGNVHLEHCNGTSRNDTGIALRFDAPNGECALVSADARYGSVPAPMKASLTSVVAPHHGAKCAPTLVPPSSGGRSRVVYSYGDGNSHGHVEPQCRSAHSAKGWANSLDTAACTQGPRGGVVVAGRARPPGKLPCRLTHCDLAVQKG